METQLKYLKSKLNDEQLNSLSNLTIPNSDNAIENQKIIEIGKKRLNLDKELLEEAMDTFIKKS